MKTFHIHNADFMEQVGRPSKAKRGDTITLNSTIMGFEYPACGGSQNIPIPPGNYTIVSRKHFRGGTQEIEPI